jgi:hypothetical protein
MLVMGADYLISGVQIRVRGEIAHDESGHSEAAQNSRNYQARMSAVSGQQVRPNSMENHDHFENHNEAGP